MANRKTIYDMTGGRCYYCGCKIDMSTFHMDHFIPKSRGGKEHSNLVPACPDCNNFKGDATIDGFREKIQNSVNSNIYGRMLSKYYDFDANPVRFYFEEKNNGTLQNNSDQLLD